MNVQAFQTIQSTCELVLAETKSSDEKRLLFSANKNLKYALHVFYLERNAEKSESYKKKNLSSPTDQELPESIKNYVLSREEIALIGQSCKLVLLFEIKCSPSSRNTKTIKALLDLVVGLLSSGIIPTNFSAGVASVEADEKGGTSVLLSKLLGSRQPREISLLQTDEEPENVYYGLVQSAIAVAETLSTRAYPERLYDAACLALRTCISPSLSREDVTLLDLKSDQLNVSGDNLSKIFGFLLGYLKNPSVSADVVENSINGVCKAVVLHLGDFFIYKNSSISGSALALESSVERMIAMTCDTLDKYSWRKLDNSDEFSRMLLGTRCLLHFFSQLIECEAILLQSSKITSVLKARVLPSTLAVLQTSDSNIYFQALTILQYFCFWRGAYKPLNFLKDIFLNVYFRTLLSSRISDVKRVYICQALPMHMRHPFDFIYLFLQRESLSTPSVLEQVVEYLCVLSVRMKDLISVLKKDETSDSMNILLDAQYQRLAVGEVWKSKDRSESEVLRNSAMGSLLEFIVSASRWIDIRQNSLSSQTGCPEKSLSGVKTYGMNKFELAYEQTAIATDLYQDFIRFFNERKKLESSVELLQRISYVEGYSTLRTALPDIREKINSQTDMKYVETWTNQKTAILLKKSDGNVNKIALGDFFSRCLRKDDVLEIFKEWISLHDFRNLTVDEALRVFLGGFKLVGEAQVVDKTMELFAEEFFKQNPSSFLSCDAAFVLAFSICMLNTDAHSPHVKNKMKLEEFIQNNRGIDSGNDIDRSVLQKIYERISQEEIVLRKDHESLNVSAIDWISSLFPVSNSENPSNNSVETHSSSDNKGEVREYGSTHLSNCCGNESSFDLTVFRHEFVRSVSEEMNLDTEAPIQAHHQIWTDPMNLKIIWHTIADRICYTIIDAIASLLQASETPLLGAEGTSNGDSVKKFCEKADNRLRAANLRNEVFHVIRLCTFFQMSSQIDTLMEALFALGSLSKSVSFSTQGIAISAPPSQLRLEFLATMINAFRVYGNSFSSYSWRIGYCTMSLLDAVANGTEGWWRRCRSDNFKKVRRITCTTNATGSTESFSGTSSQTSMVDRWFGDLQDVPTSICPSSIASREKILSCIREATSSSVDAWVDYFFDATCFSPATRIHLLEGLIPCCKVELQQGRSFSLNKLVEFLTICQSTFRYGETFFRLWNSSREVFTGAAESSPEIAVQALEDLLVIILGCLRDERNDSSREFEQKDLLEPLEDIFVHAKVEVTKIKVLSVVQDLMDRAAFVLRDGWLILLSILRGAANTSSLCCREGWELIMRMSCLPSCTSCPWEPWLSSFLDCLDVYIRSPFASETTCLTAVSLLVAGSRWICVGWHGLGEIISSKDDIPGKISRWGVTVDSLGTTTMDDSLDKNILGHCSSWPLGMNAEEKVKGVKKVLAHLRTATQHYIPRARAHAIASMWELFKVFGRQWFSFFSVPFRSEENKSSQLTTDEVSQRLYSLEECLKEFFFPMVRHTIYYAHSKSSRGHAAAAGASFDRFDYRLLVQLALKGMWVGVFGVQVEECVRLAIDFFTSCAWHIPITRPLLENEMIAAIISSFSDLFSIASAPLDASSANMSSVMARTADNSIEGEGGELSLLHEEEEGIQGGHGMKLNKNDAEIVRCSFFFSEGQKSNETFSPTHPMFCSWMTDYRRTLPFALRDFTRFSSWEELFHTGAASLVPVRLHFSSITWISSSSTSSTVKSISDGLVERIREFILSGLEGLRHRIIDIMQDCKVHQDGFEDNTSSGVMGGGPRQRRLYYEETWRLSLQNYRLILLGVRSYVMSTRNVQGLWFFYNGIRFSWWHRTTPGPSLPLSEVPSSSPVEDAHSCVGSPTALSSSDSPTGAIRAWESHIPHAHKCMKKEIDENGEGTNQDLPPPPPFMFSCSSSSSSDVALAPLLVCAELQILVPITMGVLELTLLGSSFFFLQTSPKPALFLLPASVEVENVLVSISELFFHQLIQSRSFCLEDQRLAYRIRKRSERAAPTNSTLVSSMTGNVELPSCTVPSKPLTLARETGEERRHGPPSTVVPNVSSANTGEGGSPLYPTAITSPCANSSFSPSLTTTMTSSFFPNPSSHHRATQYFAFTGVFQECCMVSTSPSGRVVTSPPFLSDNLKWCGERRYQEWTYLMCILSLKLLLSISSSSSSCAYSYLLSCVPVDVQLDLISHLPGVLEETTATEFFRLYWKELTLDAESPSSFILMEWTEMMKHSLHRPVLASPSSCTNSFAGNNVGEGVEKAEGIQGGGTTLFTSTTPTNITASNGEGGKHLPPNLTADPLPTLSTYSGGSHCLRSACTARRVLSCPLCGSAKIESTSEWKEPTDVRSADVVGHGCRSSISIGAERENDRQVEEVVSRQEKAERENRTVQLEEEEREDGEERGISCYSPALPSVIPHVEEPNPVAVGSSVPSSTITGGTRSVSGGLRFWTPRGASVSLSPNALLDSGNNREEEMVVEEERERKIWEKEEEIEFEGIIEGQNFLPEKQDFSVLSLECNSLLGN